MLMNIGPAHDGTIAPVFQERLKQIGSWLKVNGEAVYSSSPWRAQNDTLTPNTWYTTKDSAVYVFVLTWPTDNLLKLGAPVPEGTDASISMLGYKTLAWSHVENELHIAMPNINPSELPCKWSWVLKLTNFK